MNRRTVVCAAVVALCLGISATSSQAVDLRYPVAFDDRTGAVYYQNTSLFAPATFAPAATSTISTSYVTDTPLYEPAPSYAPPVQAYNPPAPTYNMPAPTYSQPALVPAPVVVPPCVQPSYVRQTVTTTYAPAAATPGPMATYAGSMNYVPRVTYTPTRVTTYRAPAAVGPRVWVHPKVYVEGQPIRNLIRAITP